MDTKYKNSNRQIYDWDRWFSLASVCLRRCREYNCSQSAMVQQIRNVASARGIRVEVEDCGDCVWIRTERPQQCRRG